MDVSIIIVNYNTANLLKNCINSIIEKTKEISYEIIVSDNASKDDSIQMLKSEFSDVIVIENSENLGFGKANNKALEIAKGKYILYLNSDTLLLNNAVKLFFDYFEANTNKNIGALGCNLKNYNNENCFSYGKFGSTFGQIKHLTKLFLKTLLLSVKKLLFKTDFPDKVLINNNYEDFFGKVDYICGADLFMLNDKNAQFDPFYFLYYEEVDLQYNLKLQNLDRIIIDGPKILHLEGGSEKRKTKEVSYLSNVSQINLLISSTYFFKKYKNSKFSIFLIKFLITLLWHNPYISNETKKYIKQINSI